jgi:hypothetical protein
MSGGWHIGRAPRPKEERVSEREDKPVCMEGDWPGEIARLRERAEQAERALAEAECCSDEPCDSCVACLQRTVMVRDERITTLRATLARVEGERDDWIAAAIDHVGSERDALRAEADGLRAALGMERNRYVQLLNIVAGHSQQGGPEPCWCFASTGAGDCRNEPQCVAATEAVFQYPDVNPWGDLYESLYQQRRAALGRPG